MIELECTDVYGWEAAIRGMRNPMNSWDKSDSEWEFVEDPSIINPNDEVKFVIGKNDLELMKKLAAAGSVHAKYRRMIIVTVDITAPLYWWKEFDTYKVGTVANSCSTMHKIHAKEFTREDFSHERLFGDNKGVLDYAIHMLNYNRKIYLETKDKLYWHQMIQILPSSYNQRRTVLLNYEVLSGIYRDRKEHKLYEWRELCRWIEELPYSEIITLKKENKSNE